MIQMTKWPLMLSTKKLTLTVSKLAGLSVIGRMPKGYHHPIFSRLSAKFARLARRKERGNVLILRGLSRSHLVMLLNTEWVCVSLFIDSYRPQASSFLKLKEREFEIVLFLRPRANGKAIQNGTFKGPVGSPTF